MYARHGPSEPAGVSTCNSRRAVRFGLAVLAGVLLLRPAAPFAQLKLGDEHAITRHLTSGAERTLSIADLIGHGKALFAANWTDQDGAGRPRTKGSGSLLTDRAQPLTELRTYNRLSGPDANSCAGCHRAPFNVAGGSGDVTTIVFQGAERFDFLTFDRQDSQPTRGAVDEHGRQVTLRTVGNPRLPPDLLGAGYIEMLTRQMTADLRAVRDSIAPGRSAGLITKGISFGTLARRRNGAWDTSGVAGLPPQSLRSSAASPPSLIVHAWRRSGSVASLREITSTSYNQHLGIQTTERFGVGTDPDGDGVVNEMTRGDVTAAVVFQATLPVPGRVIPNDTRTELAIANGERAFERIGCTICHQPSLPLERRGWIYSEPGPFSSPASLQRSSSSAVTADLTSPSLPQPRLVPTSAESETLEVPAYTDLKLHDITDPGDSTATEPLDLNQPAGSTAFSAGNRRFLTRRLWDAGNQPSYWHDGRFTTMRQAVLAHAGEALDSRRRFERLDRIDQDGLIEFLKSLQALPPGTASRIVDERFRPKAWPPAAIRTVAESR